MKKGIKVDGLKALRELAKKAIPFDIKDKSLITKILNKRTYWEIELKDINPATKLKTKLSEALQFLPEGFIYKDETGMGATTLEIKSQRHSIIVEPIRITASSKAHNEPGAFYVGSQTQYHTNKSVSVKDIQEYLADPTSTYKKIIVVADSLFKVITAIGDKRLKDFFLLIDEIDSFQMDSTYRKSMELCLDIYKTFPETNRAILSATRIDFSDDTLKKEPVTFIKYQNPGKRQIEVICRSHELI